MMRQDEMGCRLGMKGLGVRYLWPSEAGHYSQDDYLVDPAEGIAIFAAGSGVMGQGRPAAKVAAWSLWSEVTRRRRSEGLEAAVNQGFLRAHAAVERLSWRWPPGLVRPSASMVALFFAGDGALVAHLGECRVSLLGQNGLVPLTVAHRVKDYPADIHLDATVVHQRPLDLAQIPTRSLGLPPRHSPELITVEVQCGHRFLLAGPSLPDVLTNERIAECHDRDDDGAPAAPWTFAQRLISLSHGASPELGAVAFVVVDALEAAAATVPEPRIFSSDEPPLSWLYHPGVSLPDPPDGLGSKGPDAAWYETVFRALRLDDEGP